MIDGVWNLRIQLYVKTAAVTATVKDGQITGDDGHHSYSGTIKTDDAGLVTTEIHVKRHTPGAGQSLNNLDEYTLSISGSVTDNTFKGEGSIKGAQGKPYKVTGTRAT